MTVISYVSLQTVKTRRTHPCPCLNQTPPAYETDMKAANLLVRCLENEKVEYIFGIPGEENLDIIDALLDSDIRFITTRHEQGAAIMADVYGRLTGKPGVCLSTLGPGATNLVTGVADANMDNAPLVAIAGQAAARRLDTQCQSLERLKNPTGGWHRPVQRQGPQPEEPVPGHRIR